MRKDLIALSERCKYCGMELPHREICEHESSHRMIDLLRVGQAIRWAFLRGRVQAGDVVKKDVKGCRVLVQTFGGDFMWVSMEDIL